MTGRLQGKKVAILATDGFEESELLKPLEALKKEGAQVEIVAPKAVTPPRRASHASPNRQCVTDEKPCTRWRGDLRASANEDAEWVPAFVRQHASDVFSCLPRRRAAPMTGLNEDIASRFATAAF